MKNRAQDAYEDIQDFACFQMKSEYEGERKILDSDYQGYVYMRKVCAFNGTESKDGEHPLNFEDEILYRLAHPEATYVNPYMRWNRAKSNSTTLFLLMAIEIIMQKQIEKKLD